ncbi:Putative ATP-dependent DNA helicase Q1, partial [Fusarium odoratissimum]
PEMEPFIHLPPFPFVFCSHCKIGFVISEVYNHLKIKHSHLSRSQMKSIKKEVAAIPGIAKDQHELKDWEPPPPTVQPISYIQPPQKNKLGCNRCPYVVGEVRRMQEHCRIMHGWINDWKKGGNVRHRARQARQPIPWRGGVQAQQVCHWGHGRRWFEVGRVIDQDNNQQTRSRGEEGDQADSEHKTAMHFFKSIHDDDEHAFESEANGTIQNVNDKWEAEAWLNRCGWPRHLEGIDPNQLRALLQPIGDDEPVLQRMWEVFEQVLDDAYDATVRECYPGTAELFEIARKEVHITTAKPFQGLMEPDAWERYKSRWKQLLCIWKRYQSWNAGDVSSEDGESSHSDSSDTSSTDGDDSSSSPSAIHDDIGRRPPYKMTIRQEEAWKAFNHGITQVVTGADIRGRYTHERLHRSCLDTVVQFLDHPFKSGNHYDSIIISALAVMGLDEGGGWVPVTNYTPVYSAVIKVARYLVLYQSILERQGQVRQLSQWGSKQQAEEDAEGLFQIVRRKVRRFMVRLPEGEDAQPSPMNWIINTRTYGMRIRYTTPGSETIDWRGDQIIHGRVRIRMSEISDMLHGLVGQARQTLLRLTSGRVGADDKDKEGEQEQEGIQQWPPSSDILPPIPWSQIQDRHGESTLEHSFLRDEENQSWVEKGEGWVRKQIETSISRTKTWLARPFNKKCPYQEHAIRGYSRTIEQFRSQLFMLMHMLGGQPARSTEILGLRMWNTMNGGVRNIFIHEGMVCFVTMYHKGFRQTDKVKVIHRYLPREKVQRRMKKKNRRSAFLWADEVMSEEGRKESKIWHTKVGKGEGSEQERQKAKEEEAAFMDWFREPKWTSDRVRRVLQRYSTQFSGQEINISAWRQMAIGISNRYLNKIFKGGQEDVGDFGEDDDEGEGWGGDLVNSIQDLQAGHGSHIAGLIYARLFGQGEFGTMRSREEFRKASMQWHRFFGFGAEDRVEQLGGKRFRCGFDDEREEMRRKRFGRLHQMDLKGQLGQMMGPSATFRGLQEPVIRAVARGEWPIVQVTPTGGGKSLTFMLPAYCTPDGVTVVITPLVALENDMVGRCIKLGIDAYVWKSREVQRAASLVFVTPESAVSKGFRMFIERMHGQQKLDRVVVDECHTAMQYSKTFRPQIGRLGETLQDFGVPVVCLTATLKPSREMAFFRQMRFVPERVRVFREATTRPNIQYSVDIIEDGDSGRGDEEDEALIERVCDIVRTWTAGHEQGKVIIYAGTIKRVKGIAEQLGCMGYWRGVGNAAEKAQRVAEWMSSSGGEAGWMAATNALGLGIDDPNVRLVMHAGMPRQLENFVQESGRGGRDGQKSESVVVIRRSWLRQQTDEGFQQQQQQQQQQQCQDEWAWDRDAIEFTEGRVCRREVLDREMDGNIDRFGCAEGEEMCDICQGQQMTRDAAEAVEAEYGASSEIEEVMEEVMMAEEDYEKSQRLVRQVEAERRLQVMQEAKEVGEFEDLLAEWTGCCAVCKISESSEDVYHEMDACRHRGTERWVQLKEAVTAQDQTRLP